MHGSDTCSRRRSINENDKEDRESSQTDVRKAAQLLVDDNDLIAAANETYKAAHRLDDSYDGPDGDDIPPLVPHDDSSDDGSEGDVPRALLHPPSHVVRQVFTCVEAWETVQDLDMDVFDLSDPRQLQEFVLVTFGSRVGFRGAGEHTNLEVRNVMKDTFGPGHKLAGQEFFSLQGLNHKTEKLSFYNPTLKESELAMRIPCDTQQGRGIQLYLDSLGPGQMRFYCKVASPAQRRNFAAVGHKQALFSPNQPLGVNTIRKMLKSAATRLGDNSEVDKFRALGLTE